MAKSKPASTLPKDLELAYQLWAKGDVRRAREEAKRFLAAKPEGEARERAERLLADTGPDPKQLMTGAGAAAFVLVILLLLYLR
ncbi:MAG TPA: hypothetical protein VMB50_06140 [Myxococcales bacterium]|nr:hypothetical protein [Myxococcales bacterium]